MNPHPVAGTPNGQAGQSPLDQFLVLLDADRNVAGKKYVDLREKLVRFFEWKQVPEFCSEELADVVLDRVCSKCAQGEEIENVHNYAFGVARYVWLEWQKSKKPEELPDQIEIVDPPLNDEKAEEEERLDCMRRCLDQFPIDEREMILAYYEEEKREKIDERKRLAEKLGITQAYLRKKAERIREKLKNCTVNCLQKNVS